MLNNKWEILRRHIENQQKILRGVLSATGESLSPYQKGMLDYGDVMLEFMDDLSAHEEAQECNKTMSPPIPKNKR